MTFSFPLGYGRELSLAAAGFRYVVAEGVDEGGCFFSAPAGINLCWLATRQAPKRQAHEKWGLPAYAV
jgi:hypothetical protein